MKGTSFGIALTLATLVAGSASEEVAAPAVAPWLVPLAGTEPETGDAATTAPDLAAVAGWLGDARVVGLGENVHGTHTLHRLSHRIFAALAREPGFDVMALEVDQAHAAALDDFVQGRRDDLAELFEGSWWAAGIFYDAALADLLRWMRTYNRTADRPLHVAGFDLKQPALAVDRVLGTLRRLDAAAAAEAETLFARALAPGAFGVFPNVWGETVRLEIPLPARDAATGIRVAVDVRAEDVSFGHVGISAEAGPGVHGLRWAPREALGAAWTTVVVDLELPASPRTLTVSLFHRGAGTIWFEAPRVTVGGASVALRPGFEAVTARPLMMPHLQRMDYRRDLVEDPASGRTLLRIAADPNLGRAHEAALAAAALVDRVLDEHAGSLDPVLDPMAAAWTRQMARLVIQAVAWRVLVEPNRDVFLAENLRWLAETAFPDSRILALAHTSHSERRPAKMGGFLAESLGTDYATISMFAGAGANRELGEQASLKPGSRLERFAIGPAPEGSLARSLAGLDDGSFALRLRAFVASPEGAAWWSPAGRPADPLPDIALFVASVEPGRPPRLEDSAARLDDRVSYHGAAAHPARQWMVADMVLWALDWRKRHDHTRANRRTAPPRRSETMLKNIRIIVEKHDDGYVAYPLGLKGVVVGEGNTYEEALADAKSAAQFHIETFGAGAFDEANEASEVGIEEAAIAV